jgi:3-hydroxyacyl-[acyl-carrier-protein] dehydratase
VTPTPPFGRDEIASILPHREPFLLLDSVSELVPGERVAAEYRVPEDGWWFAGHFPERPVMPGVLIVEAMAQTAGALVLSHLGAINSGKLVYFMAIDHARFRKPVLPGDVLHLPVRQLQKRGNVWRFAAEARVEGRKVAEAEISAMLVARPE